MLLLFFMIILLSSIFDKIYCHDNGFTLGIRDSIMIAHSFKGGIICYLMNYRNKKLSIIY